MIGFIMLTPILIVLIIIIIYLATRPKVTFPTCPTCPPCVQPPAMAGFKAFETIEELQPISDYTEGEDPQTVTNVYGPTSDWDVSVIKDLSTAFATLPRVAGGRGLQQDATMPEYQFDCRRWKTKGVENMSGMFSNTYWHKNAFNQDLSSWDVSTVTNMSKMFYYAESFNQDLSRWDVSSVTNMSFMFYYADSFNQQLNDWEIQPGTSTSYMFFTRSLIDFGIVV